MKKINIQKAPRCTLATLYEEPIHWQRLRYWERLRAGGEEGNRDEMVGWHCRLNGHESEWTPRDSDGQGSLARCSPWGHKESDRTEWATTTGRDAERLPTRLLAVCLSASGKCLLRSSAPLIRLLAALIAGGTGSWRILHVSPLLAASLARIFSSSTHCLCVFPVVSFVVETFFNLKAIYFELLDSQYFE